MLSGRINEGREINVNKELRPPRVSCGLSSGMINTKILSNCCLIITDLDQTCHYCRRWICHWLVLDLPHLTSPHLTSPHLTITYIKTFLLPLLWMGSLICSVLTPALWSYKDTAQCTQSPLLTRGISCLSLVLYGIRELAQQHYEALDQWEHSLDISLIWWCSLFRPSWCPACPAAEWSAGRAESARRRQGRSLTVSAPPTVRTTGNR